MYTKDQLELAKMNGTYFRIYGDMVNELVREKYNISEELALIRQKDEKPDEYNEYYLYVEKCKTRVKEMIENL